MLAAIRSGNEQYFKGGGRPEAIASDSLASGAFPSIWRHARDRWHVGATRLAMTQGA